MINIGILISDIVSNTIIDGKYNLITSEGIDVFSINTIFPYLLISIIIVYLLLLCSIIFCYTLDYKEKKKSEILNTIFKHIPMPFFVSNKKETLYQSENILEVLCFVHNKKEVKEINLLDKKYSYYNMLAHTFEDGNRRRIIIDNPKNSHLFWHHLVQSNIVNYLGERAVLTFFKDIELYLQIIENAKSNNVLMNDFFHSISHEIRTPLNSIIGFSDLLINEEDKQERINYIEIVKSRSIALNKLLKDLLLFASLESKVYNTIIEELDLIKINKQIVAEVKVDYNLPTKVEFKTYFPYSKFIAKIDKVLYSKMFYNLLSNAFKFTKDGCITTGLIQQDDHFVFFVKDTGIGMPVDIQLQIFKGFKKQNYFDYGMGNGIASCLAMVKNFESKFGVYSVPNEGTLFWVELPTSYKAVCNNKEEEQYIKTILEDKVKGLWYSIDRVGIIRQFRGLDFKIDLGNIIKTKK